jgi:hypothetical protein
MGVMDSRESIRVFAFHSLLRSDALRGYNEKVLKPSLKCSTCGHPKALHGSDWGCKAGHTELVDQVRHVVVCACQRVFPVSEEKRAA